MEEKFRFNIKSMKSARRELRSNQTEAEKKLWELVRGKKVNGSKFYRQYSIGPYIVDFYCSKSRLAIELDGSGHLESEAITYDKERDAYFKSSGVKTIRFWNDEVIKTPTTVIQKISQQLSNARSPLS